MKRSFVSFITVICMLFANIAAAQELKCDIAINTSQVSGTDKSVYESMQTALY